MDSNADQSGTYAQIEPEPLIIRDALPTKDRIGKLGIGINLDRTDNHKRDFPVKGEGINYHFFPPDKKFRTSLGAFGRPFIVGENRKNLGPILSTPETLPETREVLEARLVIAQRRNALLRTSFPDVSADCLPRHFDPGRYTIDEPDINSPSHALSQLVRVDGQPVPLTFATEDIFLRLVAAQGWLEVFEGDQDRIKMATYGRHISGLDYDGNHFPKLLWSALILNIGSEERRENLFRTGFFRGSEEYEHRFEPQIGRAEYARAMERHFSEFPDRRHDINYDAIPENPKDLEELEESMFEVEGYERTAEVMQFCFNPNSLKEERTLFYEAIVDLLSQIDEGGQPYSYVVVEGAPLKFWEKIEKETGILCHVVVSAATVKGVKTYKIKVFNHAIATAGRTYLNQFKKKLKSR